MALTRRDENGGAQLAGGFQPKYRGLLTSTDFEYLKLHEQQTDEQRAADARLKLRALAERPKRDYLCDMCQDTGTVVAYDSQTNPLGSVDCPECDGTGGGGFSGSQA